MPVPIAVARWVAIRKLVFNNQPWVTWGHSYGATLVHRYVIQAPDSLMAAFASNGSLTANGMDFMKERILADINVTDMYLQQFPDDRNRLQVLHDELKIDTCFESQDKKRKMCGRAVTDLLVSELLPFTNSWIAMHEWLGIMVPEKEMSKAGLQLFLATFEFVPTDPANSTSTARYVIDWVDRDVPRSDTFHCRQARDQLRTEKNIDIDQALLHQCEFALQNTESVDDTSSFVEHLSRDLITLDQLVAALTSHPQLPLFAYSGDRDVMMPVALFAPEIEATHALTNFHYTKFIGTGHDGFMDEPKPWADVLSIATTRVAPPAAVLDPTIDPGANPKKSDPGTNELEIEKPLDPAAVVEPTAVETH